MAKELKLPVPDQTTEEVRIVKWLVQEGDRIEKGQIYLEIETDKAIVEVDATSSGILLKRLAREDDFLPVGHRVALVGEAGETLEETVEPQAKPIPSKETTSRQKKAAPTTSKPPPERIAASPSAKRLAQKLRIDLNEITGSGPGGRIVTQDVERLAAQPPDDGDEPGTVVSLSKMQLAIGKTLQKSVRDTPHFHVTMAIDMSRPRKLQEKLNTHKSKDEQLSINDLVIRATASALKQCPAVNSRLTEDKIILLQDINIGIATAVDGGLVVPVLTNADRYSWEELANETRRLIQAARQGKIRNAGKGSFTISNLGMYGIESFTAIINPPESAILAVGAIKNEPVDINGQIALRPIMHVTLCSDHRVIDGATAAEFLRVLKTFLQEQIN